MILFKTGGYKNVIEKIEATKVSDKTVWRNETDFRGRVFETRELRETRYHKYFESFDEALNSEVLKCERQIKMHEDGLSRTKAKLQEIKNTKLEDL